MTPEREQKLRKAISLRQQGIVVLEDLHDPHNAAAIFRTCDAFGIQKVCLIFEQEKRYNPRRVGKVSSSSANKWLDFEVFSSTKECLNLLKRRGYHIVATALDEKAQDFRSADFTQLKTALLFGNEHRGLSKEALQLAHETVYISMRGIVQSLNISVSAAIIIAEMDRQRTEKRSKNSHFLSKSEQTKLFKQWS